MDKRRFKWVLNADGIYYRSFAFCEDEDCPDEGGGWIGKFPDLMVGGGLVRGSHFYECKACDRTWSFSDAERDRRMAVIFMAQRLEREPEHHQGWAVYRFGLRGYVRVGAGGPVSATVVGYHRDPLLGYGLNGIMRVRVTQRGLTSYGEGARVDIGVANFSPGEAP